MQSNAQASSKRTNGIQRKTFSSKGQTKIFTIMPALFPTKVRECHLDVSRVIIAGNLAWNGLSKRLKQPFFGTHLAVLMKTQSEPWMERRR
jgi:hypothetical protein